MLKFKVKKNFILLNWYIRNIFIFTKLWKKFKNCNCKSVIKRQLDAIVGYYLVMNANLMLLSVVIHFVGGAFIINVYKKLLKKELLKLLHV